MNDFIEFISLSNPTVKVVLSGVLIISLISALIGNFVFLRKRAMIGDALAHSTLPGVCLSFIIYEEKSPGMILLYSILSGLLAMLLIDLFSRHKKVKVETAIGIVLSIFFGFGIMLLSHIQGEMGSSQAGLQHFFFGQAAAMSENDVNVFAICGSIILVVMLIFYKGFKLVSFDKQHALSVGIPTKLYELGLSVLTVMAIAIGINVVGVILMAALLITPASTARLWTNKLFPMIILGIVLSLIASIIGTFISYKYSGMPTGPWVVVCLSIFAFVSILIAPQKGVLSRMVQIRNLRKKILEENILKAFYKLDEKKNTQGSDWTLQDVYKERHFDGNRLNRGLSGLVQKGLVQRQNQSWHLSEKGISEAKRVVRAHRLWELYLANKLQLSSDHVHPSAEFLEHLIDEEMENKLMKELDNPGHGPHKDQIPE